MLVKHFNIVRFVFFFFFSSRRRHTRCGRDWSSDVCSSDLHPGGVNFAHPLTKQLAFAVVGLCVMFAVAWLDYRVFGQMAVGLYVLAVLMLVAVLFIGDSAYGSRRWFTFAGQQIQASEVAKLFVIIALARYLADRQAH